MYSYIKGKITEEEAKKIENSLCEYALSHNYSEEQLLSIKTDKLTNDNTKEKDIKNNEKVNDNKQNTNENNNNNNKKNEENANNLKEELEKLKNDEKELKTEIENMRLIKEIHE